jgi:SAM-dependent methyltransferase
MRSVLKKYVNMFMYIILGRKPWSRGYGLFKFRHIDGVLNDTGLMKLFENSNNLPSKYGIGLDERVIEYPWSISRISENDGRLLDAGSCFNYSEILDNPVVRNKDITIATLAPESRAFWDKKISYSYCDLRSLPFRDQWFDEVCSISTLGHVGMDNSNYTKKAEDGIVNLDARSAVKELLRVLKNNGRLILSVVYGKRQTIEWGGTVYAVQFDRELLDDLVSEFRECKSTLVNFYKYTEDGWNLSSQDDCSQCEYFNIHTMKAPSYDNAAAARAVVMIEVLK